ncbi:hypothetical protein QJS10_CPA01g02697 [Acorus calamus]|uniref:Uncharacterized protein n=1 Tax=Acorus calamus TaxID=4465 RepID=A0AAV9FTI5_ACOCL|nr:hypothetical protein QJS10_CPA01g02697 [Acorus calamus]
MPPRNASAHVSSFVKAALTHVCMFPMRSPNSGPTSPLISSSDCLSWSAESPTFSMQSLMAGATAALERLETTSRVVRAQQRLTLSAVCASWRGLTRMVLA